MNLLKETLDILNDSNILEDQILYVAGKKSNIKISWEHFKKIADTDYDNGYGGQEVAQDLVIVGNDFWLERSEYDGSEWWSFKKKPDIKGKYQDDKIHSLTVSQAEERNIECSSWDDLNALNGLDKK